MIKTLIASLILILIGVPAAAAAGPEIIVAHRGFGGAAQVKYGVPEHSLAAYGLAIEKAEQNIYVDLDLQHSSDGYMVDIHDTTLDRTTNCIGPVVRKKLADIKKCFLELPVDRDGNGNDDNTPYHPPSGNQSLDFLRSKTVGGQRVKVAIELKGDAWTQARVNKLRDVLKAKGMFSSRVNVHSFNSTYAGYAKAAGFADVGLVAPVNGPLPSVTTVKKTSTNVLVHHTLITEEKLQEYNAARIKVWIWTVNTEASLNRVLNFDGPFYALVTDDLVWAQEQLEESA